MDLKHWDRTLGCTECIDGTRPDFNFTMAFQPFVDLTSSDVYAQEALVRGPNGELADHVFTRVSQENRYWFDQTCRVKAIQLAASLGIDCRLSINIMPNAIYRPELCIRTTLAAADQFGFPINRIIFEITEGEQVRDIGHIRSIVQHYQQRGFLTAIDDFGAGYAGLNLLAELQTDLIKLDLALIRHIDADRNRRAIVKGILHACNDLAIQVIAEGVETASEASALLDLRVTLQQGFFFARAAMEHAPRVSPEAYAELRRG